MKCDDRMKSDDRMKCDVVGMKSDDRIKLLLITSLSVTSAADSISDQYSIISVESGWQRVQEDQ